MQDDEKATPYPFELTDLPADPFDPELFRVVVVRVPVTDPSLKLSVFILSLCLGYLFIEIILGEQNDAR